MSINLNKLDNHYEGKKQYGSGQTGSQNQGGGQGNDDPSKKKQQDIIEIQSLETFFQTENPEHPYLLNTHKHKLNLYWENKSDLKISIISGGEFDDEIPYLSKSFNKFFDSKNYKSKILSKQQNAMEVYFLYDCKSTQSFVNKRCRLQYYYDNYAIDEMQKNVELFVNEKYNEFIKMKIYSTCIYSVQPLDFQIIFYKNTNYPQQSYIITEMLMTHGGETFCLFQISKKYFLLEICDIFEQISKAAKICECFNLEHNDWKPANILIEEIEDKNKDRRKLRVRVIDFDIGKQKSITQTRDRYGSIIGSSPNYVAPEIYQFLHEDSKKQIQDYNSKYDSFKSQVYSIGLVILYKLGFNYSLYPKFDLDFKNNSTSHEKLIEEIKKFEGKSQFFKDKPELFSKIMKIIYYCISYDPEQRPSANQLLVLLKNISDGNQTISQIENTYNAIMKKPLNQNEMHNSELNSNSEDPSNSTIIIGDGNKSKQGQKEKTGKLNKKEKAKDNLEEDFTSTEEGKNEIYRPYKKSELNILGTSYNSPPCKVINPEFGKNMVNKKGTNSAANSSESQETNNSNDQLKVKNSDRNSYANKASSDQYKYNFTELKKN